MSAIINNGLPPGFATANEATAFSTPNGLLAAPATVQPGRSDNIQYAPYQTATPGAYESDAGSPAGNAASGFGSVYDRLLGALSSLFSNLGSMFGYPASPASSVPNRTAAQSGDHGQSFFTSATANSVGDPHESFTGTSASGATIDQKWDSMVAHPNLLDSNSFVGGYRVATTVTQPSAKGITQNASASVTTSGGATSISMNHDGSYAVVNKGQSLTLPTGQPQNLGNGETVTLNADRSLTIVDANARGGSITTTLKANGTGGVDVTNDAKNVDLGGSLVGHADYRADRGRDPGMPPYAGTFAASPATFNPLDFPTDLAIT